MADDEILFRKGLNAKQVQVWLGHHSPAFTLATYVHLLPEHLPESPFDEAAVEEEFELPVEASPAERVRNEIGPCRGRFSKLEDESRLAPVAHSSRTEVAV